MPPAETMTCPNPQCRRTGLAVRYVRAAQLRGGRGGAIPRARIPALHNLPNPDGTISDRPCPHGRPTRKGP
jgi:hypothetical protein